MSPGKVLGLRQGRIGYATVSAGLKLRRTPGHGYEWVRTSVSCKLKTFIRLQLDAHTLPESLDPQVHGYL